MICKCSKLYAFDNSKIEPLIQILCSNSTTILKVFKGYNMKLSWEFASLLIGYEL